MKATLEMVENHLDPLPPEEGETASLELPHVEPSSDKGRWETHNPENPNLTPASRIEIARVALALTDKYPDGWHFTALKADKRTKEKYGRVEYFVPDQNETE